MQYPIIDLITDAYINNGWTGLELTYGKNIINYESLTWTDGVRNDDGDVVQSMQSHFSSYIPLNPNTTYTLSGSLSTQSISYRIYFSSNDFGWISRTVILSSDTYTFTTPANCYYIQIQVRNDYYLDDAQLEIGTQATPYEPYAPPTTDIKNRLKLPMIHYFPHPVIDALKRAAAGTQTADDTEILRHYLTPLGIGGI